MKDSYIYLQLGKGTFFKYLEDRKGESDWTWSGLEEYRWPRKQRWKLLTSMALLMECWKYPIIEEGHTTPKEIEIHWLSHLGKVNCMIGKFNKVIFKSMKCFLMMFCYTHRMVYHPVIIRKAAPSRDPQSNISQERAQVCCGTMILYPVTCIILI